MPRKLKVFRTPIGFHDAYVAAPSRKAALKAWGAEANLFARGTAEEVTDPALTAEPLAHPGEVIRVSRGDLKAQLKALGPRKAATRRPREKRPSPDSREPGKSKPPPRRDNVDRAEAALDRERAQQTKEREAIEKEAQALEAKLSALRKRQSKKLAALEEQLDKAKSDYRAALSEWTG